ncbi:MAG TPA: TonB-dependent receptor, partial [Holophagaceae bacterium]|nr:TonB-dependent receptor [Holophagaceae bacterium]
MFSARLRALPLILVAGATLSAQTTGTLQGRVVDSSRAVVMGATVRIMGANLQGTRTVLTGEDGTYRFGLLPPGSYIVTANKDGLNPSKTTVQVGLDRTASLDLMMAPVASATVEVVENITTVDVKATTSGQNFTNETFQNLPIKRDFAAIALLAPGVTEDREGFKVYGGSGAENNYVVDGINTTGVEFGTQGKQVPVEFIQEFQVKTGGYEAEYGKATGGIINVITKSGGNEFSGDVFAYSEGQAFKTGNKHTNEGNLTKPLITSNKNFDYGFDFGGPILRDKLWFFVAYDRRSNKTEQQIRAAGPNLGDIAPRDSDRDLFAAKLTWKITGSQTLIASVLGDPEKITGAVKTPQGSQGTWD